MENINIAFCFDKNLWKQFCVSVASLLINSNNECHYNIHTVISEDITDKEKNYMQNVIKKYDNLSNITFYTANHDFDKCNGCTATYYRIQLLKFLKVEKVIYLDIDTYFNGHLMDLYNIDMKDNFICGVKDGLNLEKSWKKYLNRTNSKYIVNKGTYLNAGILLLNIKLFREENLYNKFLKLVDVNFDKLDQDMLNYVSRNRSQSLPLKYNFKPKSVFHKYKLMVKENIFSRKELEEAKSFSPIWHFMASNPWKVITKGANRWWKLCREFDFYEEMKTKFMKKANILQKLKFKAMEWNND